MMQIRTSRNDWQKCHPGTIATELQMEQQTRRAQAPKRGKAGAYARASDLMISRAEQSERIAIATMKRVERNLGLLDEGKVWGKPLYIRLPRRTRRALDSIIRVTAQRSLRSIPAYGRVLRDKRGRIAVMMRMRYMGFKSPKWSDGCAAGHIVYILRSEALNTDDRTTGWLSNMGVDAAEVTDAWKVLEEVEKGYRANAIVQYRMVLQLPYELNAVQQAKLVETFCERTFGRLGLPYVAAIHKPDADGDQRNYHAHICFSTRPTERIEPFVWRVAQEKVNQLTDPEGLKLIRAQLAAIMNRACKKAGLEKLYTHQTYQERGLDAHRTDHYGPARAGTFRRGETVNMANKNALVIDRNEAADDVRIASVRCDLADRRDRALAFLLALDVCRKQLMVLSRQVLVVAPTVMEALTSVVRQPGAGFRNELQRRQEWAVAIRQKVAAAQPAFELLRELPDAASKLDEKLSNAKAATLAIAAASDAIRQAQEAMRAAERLRALQRWAVDTAELARNATKEEKARGEKDALAHAAGRQEQAELAKDDTKRAEREGSSTSLPGFVPSTGDFDSADVRIKASDTSDRLSPVNERAKTATSAAEKQLAPLRQSISPSNLGPRGRDEFEDVNELELVELIEREYPALIAAISGWMPMILITRLRL